MPSAKLGISIATGDCQTTASQSESELGTGLPFANTLSKQQSISVQHLNYPREFSVVFQLSLKPQQPFQVLHLPTPARFNQSLCQITALMSVRLALAVDLQDRADPH
jgi:hypothetical protein